MSNETSLSQLSPEQFNTIVDRLLDCPSVKEEASRNRIVLSLPSSIQSSINRSTIARQDVINILRTCDNYPQAVALLIEQIRFEESSRAMQAFDNTLREYDLLTQNRSVSPETPIRPNSTAPEPDSHTHQAGSSTESDTKRLKIFITYAREDQLKVRELYTKLIADNFAPWFDAEDVLPGHDWQLEIHRALRSSEVVLACLSKSSVSRAALTQQEISMALGIAAQQESGSIFVIPIRLDDCVIPENLVHLSWLSLFEDNSYSRLVKALRIREQQLAAKLRI